MRTTFVLCSAAVAWAAGAAQAAPFWPEGDVDGAVTLVTMWGPEYLGASKRGLSLRPGFYLRWGRVSLSSGGGWATPRRDDDIRGLGLELSRSERHRISLGLRFDSGRRESSSDALAGMGDVKRTVRARLSASWKPSTAWELRAAWTVDAFGRGGGNLVEAKAEHDWPLNATWHLNSGAQLTLGGPQYMQTYFGVTGEQSARSGYREFDPGTSLRDLTLYATVRADFSEDWVATAGLGWTRVLGDAARSPLTQRKSYGSASAGVGWRF
ncbi:MAG: MipA/OmpV family protein [Rubrivivax sp.]